MPNPSEARTADTEIEMPDVTGDGGAAIPMEIEPEVTDENGNEVRAEDFVHLGIGPTFLDVTASSPRSAAEASIG